MFSVFDIFRSQPWKEHEPIFQFVKRNIDEVGKINDPYLELPDEPRNQVKGIKFAVGAMDGIITHHLGDSSNEKEKIENIISLFINQLNRPSKKHRINLYNSLKEVDALSIIDALMSELGKRNPNIDRLYNEVRWLALNGAHRNVIKFAIAILGRFNTDDDDILLILGKHEEFTLYTTVALLNKNQDAMNKLVELAKYVKGWGKIHIVERIIPESEEIKRWIITDGCENAIMDEYLAYTCAVNGELINWLNNPTIDYAIYRGAGRIIKALINGGPASDINDYNDGVAAIKRYLNHALYADNKLEDILVLGAINYYLSERDDKEYKKLISLGWDDSSIKECKQIIYELLSDDKWNEMIIQDIYHKDDRFRFTAIRAANLLKLDIWDKLFRLLSDTPNDRVIYHELMSTKDVFRVEALCHFALENLDFSKIIGVPEENAFGYAHDNDCLDSILQSLYQFEGVGCELISFGLQARSIRSRNMAIKVLESWNRNYWPDVTMQALKNLKKIEPNSETLKKINQLLDDNCN